MAAGPNGSAANRQFPHSTLIWLNSPSTCSSLRARFSSPPYPDGAPMRRASDAVAVFQRGDAGCGHHQRGQLFSAPAGSVRLQDDLRPTWGPAPRVLVQYEKLT